MRGLCFGVIVPFRTKVRGIGSLPVGYIPPPPMSRRLTQSPQRRAFFIAYNATSARASNESRESSGRVCATPTENASS